MNKNTSNRAGNTTASGTKRWITYNSAFFAFALFGGFVWAKTFTLIFNSNAPGISDTRAQLVQRTIPGCIASAGAQRGDGAIAGWNNGTGEYTKISCTSTIQWRERSFEDTGQHSPLLIDLSRTGFQTGRKAQSVTFDIRGTGKPLNIMWVENDTDDGFLSLDLNQNGIIDSGLELFGQGTEMFVGEDAGEKALHGYAALAQYDHPDAGGNLNSLIDREDEIWSSLRVWIDSNADGFSNATEMLSLNDAGVVSIDLRYKESGRRDSGRQCSKILVLDING